MLERMLHHVDQSLQPQQYMHALISEMNAITMYAWYVNFILILGLVHYWSTTLPLHDSNCY